MSELEGFLCRTCGEWHKGLPFDYGYAAPHYWSNDLKDDPDSFLQQDFCVIKKVYFFVRGIVEIPVLESDITFRYGVWASLSKSNFDRIVELWRDERLLNEPPYFGWLSNSIDLYPETLNLKTNVASKSVKDRPYITLQATDHPLSIEQRSGITIDRVHEFAERRMHSK